MQNCTKMRAFASFRRRRCPRILTKSTRKCWHQHEVTIISFCCWQVTILLRREKEFYRGIHLLRFIIWKTASMLVTDRLRRNILATSLRYWWQISPHIYFIESVSLITQDLKFVTKIWNLSPISKIDIFVVIISWSYFEFANKNKNTNEFH